MDLFLKEIMASPTVTKIMLAIAIILLSLISGFLVWGGKYLLKSLNANYSVFRKEIRLMNYKIDATDHALGKHFNNGYQDIRDKKFNELKDNDNFIND